MRQIAGERRRFGYRRIGLMLERDGIKVNREKLRRLYREEGFAVKQGRRRKRAKGAREPIALPSDPRSDRRLRAGMRGGGGGRLPLQLLGGQWRQSEFRDQVRGGCHAGSRTAGVHRMRW